MCGVNVPHRVKVMTMRMYSVANMGLHIACQEEVLDTRVQRAVRNMLYLEGQVVCSAAPDIRLFFRHGGNSDEMRIPDNAREIYSSPALRVSTNDEISCVIAKGAYFHLDLVHGAGTAFIHADFWDNPFKTIQECFVLSLLWLFHPHALYSIHANCLERDGMGIIFVGTSGSGKSTAGFSLIRRGWNYLSDDVNLIRSVQGEMEILAFQKGYSIDPDVVSHYPEIGAYLDAASPNGRKRILDMGVIYPEQFTCRTVPKMILFPEIVSQENSILAPIDRTMALVRLVENSGGIMVNRAMAAAQMETLRRLVHQTDCYHLICGRDVLEHPEDLEKTLSPLLCSRPGVKR